MMLFFVRFLRGLAITIRSKWRQLASLLRTRQRRHLVTLRSHSGIPHQRENRLSVAAHAR
jgi:hypothetical protein